MDRKGKQKIKLKVVTAILTGLIPILFAIKLIFDKMTFQNQNQELTAIYPELKKPLDENLSFYASMIMRSDILIMLTICALFVIVIIVLRILMESEVEDRTAEAEWELNNIYEQQFSDLKERLADEENSTKTLITDISHQLKTPLASIRMSHDLSLTENLTDEERQSFLATETQEIQKMETLLGELVKLSRLENSMILINCEKCSLKNTISEAVGQIFIKARGKKIEISVDLEKDVEISHDRKWTVEALANILENAVKYSEDGGKILIRVSSLYSHVLIQVDDEGIGIPEGEEHEIFKRFYRGSNAKNMVSEGAGVGLYLARSIIEQQGGSIVAKGKKDKGTIFQILLPLN